MNQTVVLFCSDVIGSKMGGVGIRYWELAQSLCHKYQLVLVTPNKPDLNHPKIIFRSLEDHTLKSAIKDADVVITQNISLKLYKLSCSYGIKLIADLYDPIILEYLEASRFVEAGRRKNTYDYLCSQLKLNFQLADGFICANEEQKKLWIGYMLSLGRVSPSVYDIDSNLDHYLGIVPIGMSSDKPAYVGQGVRAKFGLSDNDKVILWGGGIWNWFDPLTLIQSIYELSKTRNDIKLVFMGVKHPNNAIPEMKMSIAAIELATKLGVLDKCVFFNYGWVSYEERQSYLLDATIGVCCHQNHLETLFSYRTRVLDYFWTALPIITSEGDSFARHVRENKLGRVVACGDVAGWVSSIQELVDHPDKYAECQSNIRAFAPQFTWEESAKSLTDSIEFVLTLPLKKHSYFYMLAVGFKHLKEYSRRITPRNVAKKLVKVSRGLFYKKELEKNIL